MPPPARYHLENVRIKENATLERDDFQHCEVIECDDD
jgi:hypothetical protein